MGAFPYAYTLSLCLPVNTNDNWLKKFTKKLDNLQRRYNFFLIGGDLSKSNKIIISSNFFESASVFSTSPNCMGKNSYLPLRDKASSIAET